MAPLYKRYIPPKPSTASATLPAVVPVQPPQPVTSNDVPQKRKRDRTEDEVAERKAKKLKKRGVDSATVQQPKAPPVSNHVVQGAERAKTTKGPTPSSNSEPRSEFAHVKDEKKRHKLEKEARRARKTADRADKEAGPNGSLETVNVSTVEASQGTSQLHTLSGHDGTDATSQEEQPTLERKEKGKRRKSEYIASPEDEGDATAPVSTNGTAQKSKKDKKKKNKAGITTGGDENTSPEDETATMPQQIESTSQPKKRRHKLEAALQESNEQIPPNDAEEDLNLKKHSSILRKYQKSAKLSQLVTRPEVQEDDPALPKPVLLDLAPLPQPDPAPVSKFVPDNSGLPAWLAKPTIVSSDTKAPFATLKLNPKTVDHLSKLSFHDVLPVQQALIPLLLPPGMEGAQFFPGTESVLPDVAVGAPTGSGKTIAYLLPIIESLKKSKNAGESYLKTLVVVPTRELVMQVAAVAESLAKGSTIKVGMATGSGSFKDEQVKLIKHGRRYDPKTYKELIAKAHRRNYPPAQDSDGFDEFLDELQEEDSRMEQRIKDTVACLVSHVPTYSSAVDILIATPGRLLDHLKSTLGFSLAHLKYLVLDEADKLLDLQYDGFLETINIELERPRNEEEQDARERYLRDQGEWDESKERRVRKVVLSATMTRDVSKLVALKLKRPRMIVVRGSEQALGHDDGTDSVQANMSGQNGDTFELPPTLREYGVPVGDGSEKPLFLTELLRTRILSSLEGVKDTFAPAGNALDKSSDARESSSDSGSDSDTSSDSGSSVSDSDDTSDSDTSPDNDENEHDTPTQQDEIESSMHPSRTAMIDRLSLRSIPMLPTVLIFTSSTESASRLSHFLKALQPAWSNWIHTMTRTDSKPKISQSNPTDPVIVVSTDRAGRGLDAISTRKITHVVQYDVPRSVTGYVHRVGRTARAGRAGEAWTLYSHSEARWYWKDIAGKDVKGIKRAEVVEKVTMSVDDEGLRERLAEVVDQVRGEVFGGRRR